MAALIHVVLWCAVLVAGVLLWRSAASGVMAAAVFAALVVAGLWAGWRSRAMARRRRAALQYVQMAKQPIALG